MEAVGPVGTAEVAVLLALQFLHALLRGNRGQAVLRVGISETGEDASRVDRLGLVEADAEGLRRLDALQDVHVVGHRRRLLRRAAQAVVPTGPGEPAAGQQAGVGMQDDIVIGVADGAEHRLLRFARALQQAQCLIAVAGEHHLVEALHAKGAVQRDTFGVAAYLVDRATAADALGEAAGQRFDIGAGAALDHIPLRPVVHRQQAVVAEETDEELQRKAQHVLERHGPDRRAHRHHVVVDEALPVAPDGQVFAKRHVRADPAIGQVVLGLAVEAQQVLQHAPEGRRKQVAPLCEQRVEVVPVVFRAARRVAYRKAHLGRLVGHAELVEQADEVRVGPVVEHDKTGIDLVVAAVELDRNGAGMPADPALGLEYGHVVPTGEQVGAGQAGNTAADDGDFHGLSIRESQAAPAGGQWRTAAWRAARKAGANRR